MDNTENLPAGMADPQAQPISWTAPEFIARQKSAGWYLNLAVAAVILAALLFLLTKDVVTAAVIIGAAVFLGIFAARKPRQLLYGIDARGLTVANKLYSLQLFKSFSVSQDGNWGAINFMPLKRFAPVLTVYYPLEQEQPILTLLADYLPVEEARPDRVENLMRRIRF